MRCHARLLAAIAVLVTAAALSPLVEAHGGHEHDEGDSGGDGTTGLKPTLGGITDYRGVGFWGNVTEVSFPGYNARNPHANGDWVVWEAWRDGASDIHAYNLHKRVAIRVTDDAALQCAPRVHGDRLVWEDYREDTAGAKRCGSGGSHIWVHDLRTGVSRRLVDHPGVQRSPDVGADIVVWEDKRGGTWDVYAHTLSTGDTFPVANSSNQEREPRVFGDHVAWRDYAYGQWDVFIMDLGTRTVEAITRDLHREEGLQTDGARLYFIKRDPQFSRRSLWSYDPRTGDVENAHLSFGYQAGFAVHDGLLTSGKMYVDGMRLLLHDLGTGQTTPITLNRGDFGGQFAFENGTILAAMRSDNGSRLLAVRYSPLANAAAPTIQISEPAASERVYNTTVARGFVTQPGPWGPPKEVLIRVDEGVWRRAEGAAQWTYRFNAADLSQGAHTLYVAAVYDNAPPQLESSRFVSGPAATAGGLDLSPYYDQAPVTLQDALRSNPVFVALLLLLLVALVLLVARTYLRWLQRRPRPIEYVAPGEKEAKAPRGGSGAGSAPDDP